MLDILVREVGALQKDSSKLILLLDMHQIAWHRLLSCVNIRGWLCLVHGLIRLIRLSMLHRTQRLHPLPLVVSLRAFLRSPTGLSRRCGHWGSHLIVGIGHLLILKSLPALDPDLL